jgi:hypothetical protein
MPCRHAMPGNAGNSCESRSCSLSLALLLPGRVVEDGNLVYSVSLFWKERDGSMKKCG